MLFATGLATVAATSAHAVPGPVGNGFTVTNGDLAFILKQIKIAERHTTTLTASNPCGTLLNNPGGVNDGIPDAEQVPDIITSYGLRTVDGSCNNLKDATTSTFAASDQVFPRLTTPVWRAPSADPTFPVPSTPTYLGTGNVVDTAPRTISNLIDDQTSTNPAAIAAANSPVRSQDHTPSAVPCTTDPVAASAGPPAVVAVPGVPAGCTPAHKTLFIPNVTTDVGLSPPFNSLFTFFGQFFDHGVDQTVKSGSSVFVPLRPDDPLITLGPDGIPNSGDEVNPANGNAFMVLTRAQNQPGAVQNATNTDTPWVDQSQTYTSHASHQVFLRQYTLNAGPDQIVGTADDAPGTRPVATGALLTGLPAGQTFDNSPDMTDGESTWASVKKQAHDVLGLQLTDADVTNVPMLATDPYGKYLPGPNGLPQYVTTAHGLVEGNLANPVPVPADVRHFDTPFITDIAHNADPSPADTDNNPATPPVAPTPDKDGQPCGSAQTDPTIPDTVHTASADFAHQCPGTYDDEMLNAHAACGDGRCNENIALTSIHQIFHSEHNRLVTYIKNVLESDTSAGAAARLAQWHAIGVSGTNSTGSYNYGERLFQAARFVTEMEYQHLVFEEFARKVQPAVRPFHVYSPDINPAIEAEFAHAVYRFGHSMLDDTVARTNVDPTTGVKTDASIPLLTAFLNPPQLYNDGALGTVSAAQGAGAVIMGSSDQTGNEIDEFVTETLRNNLLGLPLDLPAINMARAREAGVPPLNEVRRQIFAQTNDGQLAPYTSWSDFGQHLKHPESLINFVAAYGTHPTIIAATTLATKRAAARAIVNPLPTDTPPADAADFMFGTGAWASGANGVTITGLDDVDLWVGGLAEVTNLFGGMLGSTFNYVFETQLEKLQDGDRFYYLARTPGLNLRSQLEGNSFSELIQRNTDNTNTLKADAFATDDCKFQLGNITSPYNPAIPTISQSAVPPVAPLTGVGSVNDDPSTPGCDENQLLLKQPDGTIQYRQINNIDPPGINAQSVYQGTSGNDKVFGGNDNDTFWGGAGNDRIEANGGDDVALGGDGNDIITDLSGADVLKGGPGNDAIDGGIGNDILLGGDGSDFINGGANDNETFAGPGNDYVIAGQGADTVFGDGGDDWIEGGTGQDLLQGDHGAPFFDDPGELAPGNDIFIGQPGENDYDAEGGDDLMAQNAAIDRNAGAGGFDWAFHQYDTIAANDDMMINNNLGGLPIQVIVNRDRWQETEADSGGPFNDVIKGTDGVLSTPRLIGGAGFQGCDALDQAGVDRITGLAALLPPSSQWLGTATETASLSTTGLCPLAGPVWGEGDIMLGGPGSDTFTGRTGDEIIDGDKELRVAISVRTNPADPATELGRTDLMEHAATNGNFGPGTTGMTLQAAVFAGLVDPGNLVNVREIVNNVNKTLTPADCAAGAAALNCDTSVYTGPLSQYLVTTNALGVTTVVDTTTVTPAVAGVVVKGDGTDTLFNIEQLKFADGTIPVPPTPVAAPVSSLSTNAFTFAATTVGGTSAAQSVTVFNSGTAALTISSVALVGANANQFSVSANTCTSVAQGGTCTIGVVFKPTGTAGANTAQLSITSNAPNSPQGVTLTGTSVAAATAPGAPTGVLAVAGNAQATVSWVAPATGGSPIISYDVRVVDAANLQVGALRPAGTATTLVVTGLTNGAAVRFQVQASNAIGTGALSTLSAPVTPVAPVVDVTPPIVLNAPAALRTPAVNATVVNIGTNVTATFSEAVQPATVTAASVTLRVGTLATGALVPAVVTYNAATHVVTLNPNANLTARTRYTVRFSTAIKDIAGNALLPVSWTFSTGPAPAVVTRTPASGTLNFPRANNITFTTNDPLLASTVTTARVQLQRVTGGALIGAVVTVNAAGTTVTLNPNAALVAGANYRVLIQAGITDLVGNPLPAAAGATAWTFRAV